jgi:hypothetical protein
MPQTVVNTGSYVLSHLEQWAQKKRQLTLIGLITVWMVWMRFLRHAANILPYQHTRTGIDGNQSPAFNRDLLDARSISAVRKIKLPASCVRCVCLLGFDDVAGRPDFMVSRS